MASVAGRNAGRSPQSGLASGAEFEFSIPSAPLQRIDGQTRWSAIAPSWQLRANLEIAADERLRTDGLKFDVGIHLKKLKNCDQ